MGFETSLRMPLLDFERVKRGIDFRIVDGTRCMQHIRLVKTELEIEKVRTVCQMVGRAFETLAPSVMRRYSAAVERRQGVEGPGLHRSHSFNSVVFENRMEAQIQDGLLGKCRTRTMPMSFEEDADQQPLLAGNPNNSNEQQVESSGGGFFQKKSVSLHSGASSPSSPHSSLPPYGSHLPPSPFGTYEPLYGQSGPRTHSGVSSPRLSVGSVLVPAASEDAPHLCGQDKPFYTPCMGTELVDRVHVWVGGLGAMSYRAMRKRNEVGGMSGWQRVIITVATSYD